MEINKIRIASLVNDSIVDGPGIRFVIFMQGCLIGCPFCHNEETWDLQGGYLEDLDTIVNKWRKNPLLDGITLSGGDPLLQAKASLYLLRKAHQTGLNVTVYSGETYEALLKKKDKDIIAILNEADYLIDGPFINAMKDLTLLYRGSKNQRIIDLRKTRENGVMTLFKP